MESVGMKDVGALLQQREDLFNKQTNVIFERIQPTLVGIRNFMIDADPSYTPGDFTWVNVGLDNELLMLVGVVTYEPGVSFILDGEMIEITADNRAYFNRPLRFGIPLSVVDKHSQAEVEEFLVSLRNTIEEENAQALADEAQRILDEEDEALQLIPVKTELDFDLDELSEEQRKALLLHDSTEKLN